MAPQVDDIMDQIRSEFGEEWLPDPEEISDDPAKYFADCVADTERMDKEAAGKHLVTERIEKKLRRTREKHVESKGRLRQLEFEMKRYGTDMDEVMSDLRKEVQMAEMDFQTRVDRSKDSEKLIARIGNTKMRDESSVVRMKEALDNGDQFKMYHKDGTTDMFFVMIVPEGQNTLLKWGPSIADLRYQADLSRCTDVVYGAKTPELHRRQMLGKLENPWFTFSLNFPKLGKVIDLQCSCEGSQGDKQLMDWVLALHQLVYGQRAPSKVWDYHKLVIQKAFCKIDDFAIRKSITRAQALSMAAYKAQFTPMTGGVKAAMQQEQQEKDNKA
jgi:hypothetical protein